MISTYLANSIIDHIFGKAAFTQPTVYVALSTTDFGATGSTGTEPSAGNYSRVETAETDWTDADARSISNAAEIAFATPSDSWGTIGYFAIFDASTGGNFLWGGTLSSPSSIVSGSIVKFEIGALIATLPSS